MNVKPLFICLISFVYLFSPSSFASEATVNVWAQYGSLPIESDLDSVTSIALPAEAHALSQYLPGDYAQSDARAWLDGRVSSFTAGFGAYGNPISAQSSATSSADWLVWSDSLPSGTPVRIWLEVSFEGQLYSEGSDFVSSARTSLLFDGDEIYRGSASFAKPVLSADGYWYDYLSPNGDLSALGWLLLDTAVGETINLTLFLQTEITCGPTWEGGARTDFSGSGYYTFGHKYHPGTGKALDVDLVLIPEPASILLLTAGALLLRRRI